MPPFPNFFLTVLAPSDTLEEQPQEPRKWPFMYSVISGKNTEDFFYPLKIR